MTLLEFGYLRAINRVRLPAEEIAATQGVDATLVRAVIKLVERSEYKRQQAAPVVKVSKKSFGMGRRSRRRCRATAPPFIISGTWMR